MQFPGFFILITLAALLAIRLAVLRHKTKSDADSFWKREHDADLAPDRDISELPYLTIPLDKLPLDRASTGEERGLINALTDLRGKKMLNLVGKTNTDLKLAYGPGNLARLKEAGDAFDQMEEILSSLSDLFLKDQDLSSAKTCLEYLAGAGSDISSVYTRLGDCYKEEGKEEKIRLLLEMVPSLHLSLEKKVVSHLKGLLSDPPIEG